MKYRVYGRVVATKYIGEFEANSKEEAEQMAWNADKSDVSVCYHCSKEVSEPEIHKMIVEEE